MSEMDNKQSEENTPKEPPTQEQIDSSIKYLADLLFDSFLEMNGEKDPNKALEDLLMNSGKKTRKSKK